MAGIVAAETEIKLLRRDAGNKIRRSYLMPRSLKASFWEEEEATISRIESEIDAGPPWNQDSYHET